MQLLNVHSGLWTHRGPPPSCPLPPSVAPSLVGRFIRASPPMPSLDRPHMPSPLPHPLQAAGAVTPAQAQQHKLPGLRATLPQN